MATNYADTEELSGGLTSMASLLRESKFLHGIASLKGDANARKAIEHDANNYFSQHGVHVPQSLQLHFEPHADEIFICFIADGGNTRICLVIDGRGIRLEVG